MPIPETRAQLLEQLETSFSKLWQEIEAGGPRLGSRPCIDGWTVKELLAVRTWWSESVCDWVDLWRQGRAPELPAEGYRWKETPLLNNAIAKRAQRESYRLVCRRLKAAQRSVVSLVNRLDDQELLDVGVLAGAGRYPVKRWISLNTIRQYTTARTFIRRAAKSGG